MKVSNVCVNLVSKWEGFYSKAYLCPAKIPTIGYGTTKYTNGQKVKLGDKITQPEAKKLLQLQLQEHASTIDTYVKVELTQNQYDALASFQYNLGKHILKGSKLLEYINTKQWDKASEQMLKYCNANGKFLQGLYNRRKEEVALFMKDLGKGVLSMSEYKELKAEIEELRKQLNNQDNSPSPWAKEAWDWGKETEVGKGTKFVDGTNPKSFITREQVIVLFFRFFSKFIKK